MTCVQKSDRLIVPDGAFQSQNSEEAPGFGVAGRDGSRAADFAIAVSRFRRVTRLPPGRWPSAMSLVTVTMPLIAVMRWAMYAAASEACRAARVLISPRIELRSRDT